MTVREMISELEAIAALGDRYEKMNMYLRGVDDIREIEGFAIYFGKNGKPSKAEMILEPSTKIQERIHRLCGIE